MKRLLLIMTGLFCFAGCAYIPGFSDDDLPPSMRPPKPVFKTEEQERYDLPVPENYGASVYGELTEQQKEDFLKNEKKYDGTMISLILQKKPQIGMTEEQIHYSVGKPNYVNRTGTRLGVTEQWVYTTWHTGIYGGGYSTPYLYLYFEDGKLTSWQN